MGLAWGGLAVSDLDSERVTAYRQSLAGRLKGSTVNRHLTYLSAFLTYCRRKGWVTENVALAGSVGRHPEPWPARTILSPEQLLRVLQLLVRHPRHERERVKAELLYRMGVRKQVVLDLEWERLDLEHRIAQYRSKGKDRLIPLSTRAVALLRALWEEQGMPPAGRVFRERTDTTLRRLWDRARKEMGLPGLRRHDLRVMFARDAHSQGASLVEVRELLGHSTTTMTERYVPAMMSRMREAVDRLP